VGSLIAAVGAAGVVIVLEHVVNKPGPAGAGDYVHIAGGLWIALGGCAAVLAGGLMAAAPARPGASRAPAPTAFPRLEPELPPVFVSGPGTGASSVGPPSA
jgi:hypothetical protein